MPSPALNKVSKLKVGMSMVEPRWNDEHGEMSRYERVLGVMLRHENTSEVVPIAPADLLCRTQPTSAGSHLGSRSLSTNKSQDLTRPKHRGKGSFCRIMTGKKSISRVWIRSICP